MGSSKTGATDSSATESDITKTETDMEIDGDDGDCPPDTDSCPFSEGEKVLAFHSVRIYEAKVRSLSLSLWVHLGFSPSVQIFLSEVFFKIIIVEVQKIQKEKMGYAHFLVCFVFFQNQVF